MAEMKRRKSGSRSADLSEFLAAVRAGLPGAELRYGVVTQFPGESSHFEIDNDDGQVLVQVLLMPEATPILALLACSAGGPGTGLFKNPAVGTEVIVGVPAGDLEADAVILTCLPSGTVPSELDATTMVLKNPDGSIRIISGGTEVKILHDGNIELTTASGHIVSLNGSTDEAILGTTYRSNEEILNTELIAQFNAAAADPVFSLLCPTAAAAMTAIATALSTFEGTASQYLSSKVKLS